MMVMVWRMDICYRHIPIVFLEPESGLKIPIILSIFRLKDIQNTEKRVSTLVNFAIIHSTNRV